MTQKDALCYLRNPRELLDAEPFSPGPAASRVIPTSVLDAIWGFMERVPTQVSSYHSFLPEPGIAKENGIPGTGLRQWASILWGLRGSRNHVFTPNQSPNGLLESGTQECYEVGRRHVGLFPRTVKASAPFSGGTLRSSLWWWGGPRWPSFMSSSYCPGSWMTGPEMGTWHPDSQSRACQWPTTWAAVGWLRDHRSPSLGGNTKKRPT